MKAPKPKAERFPTLAQKTYTFEDALEEIEATLGSVGPDCRDGIKWFHDCYRPEVVERVIAAYRAAGYHVNTDYRGPVIGIK